MSTDTLLVELLTEELPPKALARLGQAFADALGKALGQDGFLSSESAVRWFATPRRLAVQIASVRDAAPDRTVEVAGPSVKAGLDAAGKPTPALLGFARKNGVAVEQLEQRETPKGPAFFYRATTKGGTLDSRCSSRGRRGAAGVADSESHALGRGRRRVRAPGARPCDDARRARGARHGARSHEHRDDAGPSLPVSR